MGSVPKLDTAPGRRYALPGLYNLRDIGGYRAGSSRTRHGALLRSDALHRIDGVTREAFVDLGIAHIVDLRSEAEQAAEPSATAGLGATTHSIPVFGAAAPAQIATRGASLAQTYDDIVDHRAARIVEAIRVISNAGTTETVLVHCSAGKDRTGIVIAFALAAVGVDRDDIVSDYALTAQNLASTWAGERLAQVRGRGHELTPDLLDIITASPPEVMESLLARVEAEQGSIRGYLAANGMSESELDRLSEHLIEAEV